MATIIKRISARQAWIQLDERTAKLVDFEKDTTSAQMAERGDKIIERRARRKELEQRIAELKQKNGTTH